MWISQIWGENRSVFGLYVRWYGTNQNWHNFKLIAIAANEFIQLKCCHWMRINIWETLLFHHFCNVRQMHFNTVFVFVNFHVHPSELIRLFELGIYLSINCEIIQRSFIFIGNGKCTPAQSNVMRWSQNEDTFPRRKTKLFSTHWVERNIRRTQLPD